jgi:hypothetical protein
VPPGLKAEWRGTVEGNQSQNLGKLRSPAQPGAPPPQRASASGTPRLGPRKSRSTARRGELITRHPSGEGARGSEKQKQNLNQNQKQKKKQKQKQKQKQIAEADSRSLVGLKPSRVDINSERNRSEMGDVPTLRLRVNVGHHGTWNCLFHAEGVDGIDSGGAAGGDIGGGDGYYYE